MFLGRMKWIKSLLMTRSPRVCVSIFSVMCLISPLLRCSKVVFKVTLPSTVTSFLVVIVDDDSWTAKSWNGIPRPDTNSPNTLSGSPSTTVGSDDSELLSNATPSSILRSWVILVVSHDCQIVGLTPDLLPSALSVMFARIASATPRKDPSIW